MSEHRYSIIQRGKKEVKKQGNQNFGDVAFENKSNDVGYLKVSTFAPHKFIRYQRKIKRAFKNLKRNDIDTLIIDLRGNAGGLSTEVEYLYSFIDKKGYL
jgi:C-terminal processing protease CtpA/Prc